MKIYPYLVQYAETIGISIDMAANDLILECSLKDALLIKTEVIRVKYLEKVKIASKKEEFTQILHDFRLDTRIAI